MTTGVLTLVELMKLDRIAADVYMSLSPAFCPGGYGNAYGGHVFAQSAWAAAQTVPEGMVIHNCHGFFTLPGKVDRPYIYVVEEIGTGKSYCTRSVSVRQPLSPSSINSTTPSPYFPLGDANKPQGKICFKGIVSFKRDEDRDICHQETKDLTQHYKSVLAAKKFRDHACVPSVDAPWFHEYARIQGIPDNFPGLIMRKVDMQAFNTNKSILDYRQLMLYCLHGAVPDDNLNMHAVAHLYASDRNSLFLISNALGFPDAIHKIGSLSHSVVLHASPSVFALQSDDAGTSILDDDSKWFVQEAYTPRSGGGRGMHESRIWDGNGVHVASSWQEGLLRRAKESEEAGRVVKGVRIPGYASGILQGLKRSNL